MHCIEYSQFIYPNTSNKERTSNNMSAPQKVPQIGLKITKIEKIKSLLVTNF